MAIERVDLPMKKSDFPQLCERLPQGSSKMHRLEFYQFMVEYATIWYRYLLTSNFACKNAKWREFAVEIALVVALYK